MKNIVQSFTTRQADYLSIVSILLAVFLGGFTTSLIQSKFNFITVSIFLLTILIELGISVMVFAHSAFELANNKQAIKRSYIAISLGFLFNTILIFVAYRAAVFVASAAVLYWVVYSFANILRIFFGMASSAVVYTDPKNQAAVVEYYKQQDEIVKLQLAHEKTLLNAKTEIAKLDTISKGEIRQLAAANEVHIKPTVVEKFGQIVAGATSVKAKIANDFKRGFDNGKPESQRKPIENQRKSSENAENFDPKNKSNSVFEIVGITISEKNVISVRLDDGDARTFNDIKTLKSNRDLRKRMLNGDGNPNPKYCPNQALFLEFVIDNLPTKSDTGLAFKSINEEFILDYIDTRFNKTNEQEEHDNITNFA